MSIFQEHLVPSADGLSLYVRDYGDPAAARLPLLCLAGINRNSKDFHALAVTESRRRRVIAPDYRGRGRSAYDAVWQNYRPETYLADIGAILAALGIPRVVILGTSMGGLLAMGLNAFRPGLVAGVILNDIGPDLPEQDSQSILERIVEDRAEPDFATAARHMARDFPHLGIKTEQGWRDLAERSYRLCEDGLVRGDFDPKLAWPVLRNIAPPPDLWPLFRALVPLPVLLLRGGISEFLTEASVQRMIAAKPDLLTVTVPGVGHTPLLNEPEVEGPLHDFLARF